MKSKSSRRIRRHRPPPRRAPRPVRVYRSNRPAFLRAGARSPYGAVLGTAGIAFAIGGMPLTLARAGRRAARSGTATEHDLIGETGKKNDSTKDKNQAPATETTAGNRKPRPEGTPRRRKSPRRSRAPEEDNDHGAGRAGVANGDHAGSTAHPALAGRLGTPERSRARMQGMKRSLFAVLVVVLLGSPATASGDGPPVTSLPAGTGRCGGPRRGNQPAGCPPGGPPRETIVEQCRGCAAVRSGGRARSRAAGGCRS